MSSEAGSSPGVWDAAASDYDSHRRVDVLYSTCVRQAIRSVFRDCRGGVVLDAGCGAGLTTAPLLRRFERVVGLDFSSKSLEALRRRTAGAVEVVRGDLREAPFPDATFDAVLCANALQHIGPGAPQSRAAAELRRVAKIGAPIVVTVHHYSRDKQERGWIKEGKPGQPGIDYIFRFTRSELEQLFPGARVSAIGFGAVARVPAVSSVLQDVISEWFGESAARAGLGHMLLCEFRKTEAPVPPSRTLAGQHPSARSRAGLGAQAPPAGG